MTRKPSGLKNIEIDMPATIKWMVDNLEEHDITMDDELLTADIDWLIKQASKYERLLEKHVDLKQRHDSLKAKLSSVVGEEL